MTTPALIILGFMAGNVLVALLLHGTKTKISLIESLFANVIWFVLLTWAGLFDEPAQVAKPVVEIQCEPYKTPADLIME